MQIQINTDKNISGNEAFAHSVEEVLKHVLSRFSDQITRVEAHFSDVNSSAKSGAPDKRCLLEVRVAGQQPIAVSEQAQSLDQAVKSAAHQMVHLLESKLGKHKR
ncbi:MAG: HPF/RaiA family ribosome-associated protein [Paraperlucidibaca sp.]